MSPKQFLTYTLIVGGFALLVNTAALIQFIFIMNVPMKPLYFIIPSIVGIIFGSLLVLYRHYYLLAEERKMYEQIAKTDTLTGTMSRYACELILTHESKRCQRTSNPFSVALLDLDDFKSINDRFGHPTGDRVLKSFSQLISQELREMDTLCRWGGEEFIIILPETDGNRAVNIVERLRHCVTSYDFDLGESVTVSIGVASSSACVDVKLLIAQADEALYEAKAAGKNCVLLHQLNGGD
jgi:diguanylate cyclase (GGDEF)-like protein